MDPNANLAELRELCAALLRSYHADEPSDKAFDAVEWITDAARALELLQALDAWIAKGGFLPARWQVDRGAQ